MKNLIIEEICCARMLTVSREYLIVDNRMEIKVYSTFWSKWSLDSANNRSRFRFSGLIILAV